MERQYISLHPQIIGDDLPHCPPCPSFNSTSCTRPAQGQPSSSSGSGGDWRLDATVGGGGLFLDLGSHMLDLVDWLLGPLQGVRGIAARSGAGSGGAPSSTDVENNVRVIFSTAGEFFPPFK
jgi:predicted dehydrogenase